jgi:hypothetical protein
VVYVATDNNSIYAIDATTGKVLLDPNFGPPVVRPLGCGKNNPDVGINSTPVIDLSSNTLYAVIYTQQSTGPAYFVHALDLGSLTDKVTPQLVAGSHTRTLSAPLISASVLLCCWRMATCMRVSEASATLRRTSHEAGFWDGRPDL